MWKGSDWVALPVTCGLTLKTAHAASAFQAAIFSQALAGFFARKTGSKLQGTDRHCSETFNTSNHGAQLSCGLVQPGHLSAFSAFPIQTFLI